MTQGPSGSTVKISRYYHSVAYGHKLFTTKYAPTVRDFLAVKVPLDESGVFDLLCCEVANPTCHKQMYIPDT